MRWIDLLRMSSGNLKRRKLRTFLTVLGVVIGTASIVVMISLGLGLRESAYREVEKEGGMTAITVTGKDIYGGDYYYDDGSGQEDPTKYITVDTIAEIRELDHVKSATPTLNLSSILLSGKYYGYVNLIGMKPEELKRQNMELSKGSRLPDPDGAELELLFGNQVLMDFYEKSTDKGYWETQELPDIDVLKDQMFLVLDQGAYFDFIYGNANEDGTSAKPPKKHIVHGCGLLAGDMETYSAGSWNVYCDIDILEAMLKKDYIGKAIPGQPTTATGKPYSFFTYSEARVQADDIDNVETLAAEIQGLGYRVSTNAEYLKSMQKEFAMIEAVLGGIGAVSLFVAAIGIANTMMMSIYERTKEIGVIKVLGCSLGNIRAMFLMEAAFIGLIGGIVGNLLSLLMSLTINKVVGGGAAMGLDGNISYIPPWLMLGSIVFAVVIGMAAGFFPALRAMRLSPLAAIRNE